MSPIATGSRRLEATSWSGEIARESQRQMEKATVAPVGPCRKLDSERHTTPSAFRWTAIFDRIGNENELPLQYPPQVEHCATIWALRGWNGTRQRNNQPGETPQARSDKVTL